MSTPVKTCQSQGGIQLERDSTGPPTPAIPPSSVSKRYISSGSTCQSKGGAGLDIPALPVGVYFGCAAAVDGDATLSCPSPPTFATGDFGRPCASATPASSYSERNISPAITCLSQDAAGLEHDSMAARTPAAVAPQSSASERNISPAITCQSQDGAEIELDSTDSRTPTVSAPPSSVSERHTSPSITCPSQDGAGLERDGEVAPPAAALRSHREPVLTRDGPSFPAAVCSGYAPAVNGDDTLPTHLTAAFAMLTSAKTCQPEGGAALERDNKDTPVTVAP
jgi:hypothetical protein